MQMITALVWCTGSHEQQLLISLKSTNYFQWLRILFLVVKYSLVLLQIFLISSAIPTASVVYRVLGYRSGGPGSIPGTTRKKSSVSGTGSTQPREYNRGAT
jgi:hypothetical protein